MFSGEYPPPLPQPGWRLPFAVFLVICLLDGWVVPAVAKADYPHDGPLAVTQNTGSRWTSPMDGRYPQGVWFMVRMLIANTGNSPQTYWADYQRFRDSAGRQYVPDLRASAAEYTDPDNLKRTINPGNQGIAVLVFDMPTGAQPSDLVFVFHAASDSPGVAINLDWKS